MSASVSTLTLHTCALCQLRKGILVDVAASGCHMETGTQEEILEMTLHHLLVMRHQLVEELLDKMSAVRDCLTDTLRCWHLDSLNEGKEERCGLEQLRLPHDCC